LELAQFIPHARIFFTTLEYFHLKFKFRMISFSHDDLKFLDKEDSFMENDPLATSNSQILTTTMEASIPTTLPPTSKMKNSNEVEISHHGITPTSTAITCEFHLNNIPGDSPGFSAGGCKHVKNKSYGQFRGEKRNAVISLLDGDLKSTTPSELN